MDYKKIYDSIIKAANNRVIISGCYTELHHILPLCIGGTDDVDNLVRLYYREHFLAHWLLSKIYKGTNKEKLMLRALTALNMNGGEGLREIEPYMRTVFKRAYSLSVAGDMNPMYNRKPHNLEKPVWYSESEGRHIFSEERPTDDAVLGRKLSKGRSSVSGANNHMYGVNLLESMPESKLLSMMRNRKNTYNSKSDEEKALINKARAFGYRFNIDGVYYPTMAHATAGTGLGHKAITRRCKSEESKYSEWKMFVRESKFKAGEY